MANAGTKDKFLKRNESAIMVMLAIVAASITLLGVLMPEIRETRSDQAGQISSVQLSVSTEVRNLSTDLRSDISELRKDLRSSVSELRSDMREDVRELSDDINAISGRIDEFGTRSGQYHPERREQMTGVRAFAIAVVMIVMVGTFASAQTALQVRTIVLPVGAIVAFPSACPADENWQEYTPSQGRFLIGAGLVREMEINLRPGDTSNSVTHDHSGRTGSGGNARGVDNDNDHWPSAHEHTHEIKKDAHLPPYVAVVFCQLK